MISQKQADFSLFKSAIKIISQGEHLTDEGLVKIVSIKASMNKGLSEKLLTSFPDLVLADRPKVLDQEIRNNYWVTGFADGEGTFYTRIIEATAPKSVNRVSFFFAISQSIRDKELLQKISKFLGCGTTSENEKYIQLRVTKFEDIKSKFIPFFNIYPMRGIKERNFRYFCIIFELVQSKAHLTRQGLDEIIRIKEGMNLRRKD